MTELVNAARNHYEEINADIANAKDRIEHIRLTTLAQSAYNLLTDLIAFDTGLDKSTATDTPLPIQDFVSPFNPDA